MPLTTVRNVRRHPVDLANGRMLAPTEKADADLKEPHNHLLVETGALEVVPPPASRRRRSKKNPTPPGEGDTPKED